ncbi:hypothetical protein [Intrasporangium sp. DVR]|uniref:hypothetical protein n=1 Tax=Intrasporangium sp. DVR TaxID=3127867 RepID=UPI00313A5AAC
MNLTDLRDELDLRAHDVEADTGSLSDGVRTRIRATKRRRAGGAVGGVAAGLLAVGMIVANQPVARVVPAPATTSAAPTTVGADGMPFRAVPDSPGDVVKDGLRLRATVAEDTLAVGVIGDPGQRVVRATWTPRTQRVAYVVECWLPPGQDQASAKETWVRASISGQEGYFGGTCRAEVPPRGDLLASITPGEPGEGNPQIRLGTDTTLRVELVDRDGRPLTNPGVRLAAGVYDLGPQRLIEDELGKARAAVPEVIEHQGFQYRLERLVSGPADRGPLPEVSTPVNQPFVVTFGSSTPSRYPRVGTLYLSGLESESSRLENGSQETVPQPARAAGTVELSAEGARPVDGVAYIAVYTPVD